MKKRERSIRDIFYALIIGLAIVAFWRGAWGIMDEVIFPNNYLLSSIITFLSGILILYSTKKLIKGML